MDDMRNSFSRLKKEIKKEVKDFKHRLTDKLRGSERTGADTAGERVDSSDSLLRPEPSGHDGEGSKTTTGDRQMRSRDQSPLPESTPPGGGDDDRKGGEADLSGSQRHSRPDLDVEVVVESGPSREVDQIHLSPSALSISPTGESSSM